MGPQTIQVQDSRGEEMNWVKHNTGDSTYSISSYTTTFQFRNDTRTGPSKFTDCLGIR